MKIRLKRTKYFIALALSSLLVLSSLITVLAPQQHALAAPASNPCGNDPRCGPTTPPPTGCLGGGGSCSGSGITYKGPTATWQDSSTITLVYQGYNNGKRDSSIDKTINFHLDGTYGSGTSMTYRYTSGDSNSGDCDNVKSNNDYIEFNSNPTDPNNSHTPGYLTACDFGISRSVGTNGTVTGITHKQIDIGDTKRATLPLQLANCADSFSSQQFDACISSDIASLCDIPIQDLPVGKPIPTQSDQAKQACAQNWHDQAYHQQPVTFAAKEDPAASTDNGQGDPELDCQTTKTKLDWLICPVVKIVNSTLEGLDNAIISLLSVDPKNVDENSKDPGAGGPRYYAAWKSFRDIALGLLVIAALIMLIGQALGFEVLDAYTLKKVMPRLVVAIIGIALSWQIMKWFVIFTNDLGFGIRQLIYLPFRTLGHGVIIGGGSSVIITLLTAAGILSLKIGGLATLAGTALLALFIAFMVMVVRQMVIMLLIMMAPIAIAAYVLPNTQGIWKLWHESFTKGLLMFPIIMAFLATGRVFAQVSSGPGHTVVGDFVAFFAYILPYFLIPLTFRFAGGALRTIGGFANDKSRGAFDRLKKRRQAIMSKNWNDAKSGKYLHGTGGLATSLNRGIQAGTLLGSAGFNPRRMGSKIRAARSTRTSALAAKAEESQAAKMVFGNDDLLTAALHGNGTDADARQYLHNLGQRGTELEQNVQSIRQAKQDMGVDAFNEYAGSNLAGTGTGYRNGPADMLRTINRIAGNDRAKAGRMLVAARSAAQRAQRTDLYGAGMSVAGDLMAQQYAGQVTDEEINTHMTDEALRTKSATEVAQSRGGSVRNMQPAMARRLAYARDRVDAAHASGDAAAIGEAEHNYKRVLAATAQMQDEAGRASPENAQMIGALLGQTTGRTVEVPTYGTRQATDLEGNPAIDTTTGMPVMERVVVSTTTRPETYLDQIESMRADPEFQQYRREYGSASAAAAAGGGAAAAAAGAEAAGGGGEH